MFNFRVFVLLLRFYSYQASYHAFLVNIVSSAEQLPALETVVLPEDGFHSVYVSAVENPELFFVQLTSSEEG